MLVAGRAHVVGAIDVPPVPGFGQIRNVQILMRTRGRPVNGQVVGYISSAAATHSVIHKTCVKTIAWATTLNTTVFLTKYFYIEIETLQGQLVVLSQNIKHNSRG